MGSREGHSTITSLAIFKPIILEPFSAGSRMDTVFMDLEKSFDSVDDLLLINTFKKFRCCNPLLSHGSIFKIRMLAEFQFYYE